jgi:hypothetical protein
MRVDQLSFLLKKEDEILSSLGYKPFSKRVDDILLKLESLKNKELSNFLSFPVYDEREGRVDWVKHDLEGIYSIDLLDNFIGDIPFEKKKDIIANMELLNNNPFMKVSSKLLILAPKNNFATTNNIEAIDPIVFAHVCIKQKYYLIPIAQWL